ncbi:Glutaredoxin family protein [Euphorbia peplus]|nr:Glutaredoxin family protein [Euphorbia peplus]
MKSMKGRFMKKLTFLPLKTTLISHHNLVIPSLTTPESTNTTQNDKTHSKEVEETPSLSHFELKCPPGGTDSVILYTTSLRSIRKTFEDCRTIVYLLQSFKVKFIERDVSMDMEFREELWKILGGQRVIPPKLFIRGRYIGGADEVVSLHEQGKLKNLLQGIPQNMSINVACSCCSNQRFLVCFTCHGGRRLFKDGDNLEDQLFIRCPECNENGLIKCSVCS